MERVLILLVAALMVYVAPGVQGTAHLSFANNTEVNITRDGCGTTKLCVETPDDCDPTGNDTCLFASLYASPPKAPNGSELSIELRGYSMGYVALGLTVNASEGTTMLFICAQNSSTNGMFFFRTMDRNNTNNILSPNERITTEIRGVVKGNVIRCEFNIPNVNATNTRTSDSTTFSVLLGTGPVNAGGIGDFNVSLNSGPLNLANPASNVATTPAPSNTTNSSNNTTPMAHLSFANNTEVNITRDGCGTTKLCVETPDDCDPTGNDTCLFASLYASPPKAPNGSELSIELRGYSMGYVALGLTVNASEGTTMLFICAQNSSTNGTFFFQTRDRNNTDNMLSPNERITTEIRGVVKGNVIRCEFNIPNVNATNTRTSDSTTFSVLLGTGPVNGGVVGDFNVSLNSGPLNLANPASNVATTPAPSNTTPMGSSGAVHANAVLLLLSVLTLSVVLKA